MKKHILFCILLITCFASAIARAKAPADDTATMKRRLPPIRKFYVGTSTDAGIFSTANIQKPGTPIVNPGGGYTYPTTNTTGTLRFSYIINFGFTFNFNLARHFGLYTGIDIKNLGFIEKDPAGETVKRRTYNIGAPIGVKIGNMADKGSYLFFGGGADLPFNYKEKYFTVRNEKTKYNEWFSSATPSVMPYVFAGFAVKNMVSLKLQYYTGNFLNSNYTGHASFPASTGYDVHIMALSIGFPMPVGKHKDMVKKHVADLNTATM